MKRLKIILGIVLAAAMLFVFQKKRIAVCEDITFSTMESRDIPVSPGDCVKQDIYIPYDRVEKVSIALSYPEEISQEAIVLVEVIAEGKAVMSQELRVNACANGSFLDFLVDLDRCEGRTITVSVSNVTPETVSGGEFALLASDKEFLFVDGIGTGRLNDRETGSSIFVRASCLTGYSYYESATAAFLVFLVGAVVIERLGRRRAAQ